MAHTLRTAGLLCKGTLVCRFIRLSPSIFKEARNCTRRGREGRETDGEAPHGRTNGADRRAAHRQEGSREKKGAGEARPLQRQYSSFGLRDLPVLIRLLSDPGTQIDH